LLATWALHFPTFIWVQQQQHQHQALMADHMFGVLLSILVPERSTLSAFPEITIRESGNYYFIWTGMMLAVGFFPYAWGSNLCSCFLWLWRV
jgi:hypothetical protein